MAFVPFVESDQPTMAAFNEKFQQNYDAILAAAGKVEVGSYAGSGETSKSFIFGFVPKIVFISGNNQYATQYNVYSFAIIPCHALTATMNGYGYLIGTANAIAPGGENVKAALSGQTLTISGDDTDRTMNTANQTYKYLAIG